MGLEVTLQWTHNFIKRSTTHTKSRLTDVWAFRFSVTVLAHPSVGHTTLVSLSATEALSFGLLHSGHARVEQLFERGAEGIGVRRGFLNLLLLRE